MNVIQVSIWLRSSIPETSLFSRKSRKRRLRMTHFFPTLMTAPCLQVGRLQVGEVESEDGHVERGT